MPELTQDILDEIEEMKTTVKDLREKVKSMESEQAVDPDVPAEPDEGSEPEDEALITAADPVAENETTPTATPTSQTQASSADDTFTELRKAIESDVQVFNMRAVGRVMFQEVAIKHKSRLNAVVMEKPGVMQKVQPYSLTDITYKVVTKPTLARILKETQIDRKQYQADDWDCEDFARALVSQCNNLGINSVGRVGSNTSRHSFNIAIVREGKKLYVVFIEPQSDAFVEPNTGDYFIDDAWMIIS